MKNSEFHKVLAYGSNLDSEDWDKFVARYAQSNVVFRSLGKVLIPDYGLVFDKYAHSRKGGVANIRYNKGSIAEAVLFDANDEAIRLLRQKEGHPNHYEEKEIYALREDGSELKAKTYIYPVSRSEKKFVKPSEEYLDICRKGYRKHGLEVKPLEAAAIYFPIHQLEKVFFYGTLMRGEFRFEAVADMGVESVTRGKVRGSLTTNGSFPGLDLERYENFSEGELFDFYGNIQEILTKTDNIEGFRSFGDPDNYFRRTCAYIDTGDNSRELAWVYTFDGSLGSDVSKNDWRLHTCTLYEALDAIIDDFDKIVPDLNKILLPTAIKSEIFDPVELLAKAEITERQLQYWTGYKIAALDFNLHSESA
jgi:gamma-glutamylcyclotransferase (GGCT)/AIG2-like uncharacterized protein YtfP